MAGAEPFEYEGMPNLPPNLPCRTLSTHHWLAAEIEMVQNRKVVHRAGIQRGEFDTWVYLLIRENAQSTQAIRHSILNGEVKSSDVTTLPKSHRCKGFTSQNRRCKNKTYWFYCDKHNQ